MQLRKCRDKTDINGQLYKPLCRFKKNVTKSENEKRKKNLTNSIKLDLPSCPLIPLIFIKRYTRCIIFVMFCLKLSNSWTYLWTTSWRFAEDIYKILRYKILKKKLPISLKYILENFPFTPYIFIKKYIWSNNFEKIHWKLSIS